MAEEEKTDEEGAEGEEGEPKKSKKKMLFIVIGLIVVLLAGIGVASFMFLGGSGDSEGEHEAESDDEHTHYATFEMDPIIVNLSESTSFLKLVMVVEYDPEILALGDTGHGHGGGGSGGGEEVVPGGFPGMLSERQPMIKDAIIRVMSSKTAEELLSVEGKEMLKEELIEAMNDATGLDEGPIVNIYFIDFIIQ